MKHWRWGSAARYAVKVLYMELVASFPSRRRFSHAPRWRAPASYERVAVRIMRAAPWQHMGENARARGVFLSTRS